MSPTLALVVLSWIAIVILYLGLAAVLREVRSLRRSLAEKQAGDGGLNQLSLPRQFLDRIAVPDQPRTVLVADSGCPLCRHAIAVLAAEPERAVKPVLLTYESPDQWTTVPDTIDLVRDHEAWSTLAHLSPPVVLTVEPDGQVSKLLLPMTEQDVVRGLRSGPPVTLAAERMSS